MGNGLVEDVSPYYITNPDFTVSLMAIQDFAANLTNASSVTIYVSTSFGVGPTPRINVGTCKVANFPVISAIPDRTGPRISASAGGFVVGTNDFVHLG